jgi:acyl-CoA thioester hydrolase
MTHRFTARVYYEDTDLGGIVYYANYLKFIERARSELVREIGVDQGRMREEAGIVFAVRHLVADYLSPARFDDLLEVSTRVHAVSGARIVLDQAVLRDGARLFQARVTLVCLGPNGPARIPADIRRALEALQES